MESANSTRGRSKRATRLTFRYTDKQGYHRLGRNVERLSNVHRASKRLTKVFEVTRSRGVTVSGRGAPAIRRFRGDQQSTLWPQTAFRPHFLNLVATSALINPTYTSLPVSTASASPTAGACKNATPVLSSTGNT